jgi:hypothetical protein
MPHYLLQNQSTPPAPLLTTLWFSPGTGNKSRPSWGSSVHLLLCLSIAPVHGYPQHQQIHIASSMAGENSNEKDGQLFHANLTCQILSSPIWINMSCCPTWNAASQPPMAGRWVIHTDRAIGLRAQEHDKPLYISPKLHTQNPGLWLISCGWNNSVWIKLPVWYFETAQIHLSTIIIEQYRAHLNMASYGKRKLNECLKDWHLLYSSAGVGHAT